MINVKFQKTNEHSTKPSKKYLDDFAFDLEATDYQIKKTEYGTYQVIYNLGIKTQIPNLYGIKIAPRSSIFKTRLRLVNPEGIIDSSYRGEWLAIFDIIGFLSKSDKQKLDNNELLEGMYEIGDRVVQCYALKREDINWKEVEKVDKTERNKGGFGSTGK